MYQFADITVVLPAGPTSRPTQAALDVAEQFGDVVRTVRCADRASDADSQSNTDPQGTADHNALITDDVVQTVRTTDATDLIVVGTRPASRATRTLLTPTAVRLIRAGVAPVWCVKPGRIGLETTVAVAVDCNDPNAETLIDWGVEIASHQQGGLLLIHAVENGELTSDVKQSVGSTLQSLLSMSDHGSVPGGVRPHIAAGRADDVILDALEQFDVDLLLLNARTTSPYDLGETAESVLPQLRCSVLVNPAAIDA